MYNRRSIVVDFVKEKGHLRGGEKFASQRGKVVVIGEMYLRQDEKTPKLRRKFCFDKK